MSRVRRTDRRHPATTARLAVVVAVLGAAMPVSPAQAVPNTGPDAAEGAATTVTRGDLGTLGGVWSRPTGLNNRGQVIGDSETASGAVHAFRWRDGAMTDLGTPGTDSFAAAVNERGEVAGTYVTDGGGSRAFRWRDGVVTGLGTLGGDYSSATDINVHSDVVGSSVRLDEQSDYGHAFHWRNGVMTELPGIGGGTIADAINDRGDIVGSTLSADGGTITAALWRGGRLIRLIPPFGDPAASMASDVTSAARWSVRYG
jgi:probable HAF family extracellular repeat protein